MSASPSSRDSRTVSTTPGVSRGSIQKHTKSRTGCTTCKRRKVKCDEHRPSCRNCVKHGARCDFTPLPPRAEHETVNPIDSLPALNLVDLELFHNFTTATYATLSTDHASRNIWKNAIARKATRSDFVMRALLSVSALHISRHRPEQKHRYLSYAIAYHDRASHQAATLMGELIPENLEDLWIFSVLTMYFALGSPQSTNFPLVVGENMLPEWTFLFNGVHHISNALHPRSYSGILSPIIKHGTDRWEAAHRSENEGGSILSELSIHIEETVADEEHLAIYRYAIQELNFQLNLVLNSHSQDLDIMDAFVWHFAMAENFMPLLQQGSQEAIVIFAHSLIIFSAVGRSTWLYGWDTVLLSRSYDVLDDRHRLWLQWPIEEIGWVPPY
ncbi:hypothetical protein LTR56_024676 [Elasticomyces elasticus]|nr:hypothetical protein LTR56_024676 [Elasticomyces elasticus]KAK3622209.1 hypothetical protein LTR22_024911 [Elasticomyces elasticus]KAK4907802.1 hypothetical protein LTR49_023200 [Elasticomyces elasticus]KAK5747965.1 hypothetical protein LTS12_021961 [Elasticomyces elasticus]